MRGISLTFFDKRLFHFTFWACSSSFRSYSRRSTINEKTTKNKYANVCYRDAKLSGMHPILHSYVVEHWEKDIKFLKVLHLIKEDTEVSLDHISWGISIDQASFIKFFVEMIRPLNCLDIGTFTGSSSLAIAYGMPIDGNLITCDMNPNFVRIAQYYHSMLNVSYKIDYCVNSAINVLNHLNDHLDQIQVSGLKFTKKYDGLFDFIFIDCDKINQQLYFELSLNLLRQNGIIMVDNVLWSGAVADCAVTDSLTRHIREFNTKILNDARVRCTMVPVGDGIALISKL